MLARIRVNAWRRATIPDGFAIAAVTSPARGGVQRRPSAGSMRYGGLWPWPTCRTPPCCAPGDHRCQGQGKSPVGPMRKGQGHASPDPVHQRSWFRRPKRLRAFARATFTSSSFPSRNQDRQIAVITKITPTANRKVTEKESGIMSRKRENFFCSFTHFI